MRISLSHLSDTALLREFVAVLARERATMAEQLVFIAEIEARRLYLPAAHPSMYSYCVHELHLCEQAALRRIRAARTARRFPAIFPALAEGRLHLTAVLLLAPYLTEETADELLAAAAHKTKAEIEELLAQRFPRPDLPARVEPLSSPESDGATGQLSPATVQIPVPVMATPVARRVTPLAPERFALQLTIDKRTHDMLRHVRALLGHQVPSGDLAKVLERALEISIGQLEKTRFAATDRPRHSRRRSTPPGRHIPAAVQRAVWERDGGQCTFVSDNGRRCQERGRLEFDHVVEVARGGEATVDRIRLRCRAHNQYGAECTFGTEFMRRKREASRCAAVEARAKRASTERAQAEVTAAAVERARERDVVPWLRQLGCRAEEARRAAAYCETMPDASLEERLRAALSFLTPGHRRPRSAIQLPAAAPVVSRAEAFGASSGSTMPRSSQA